MTIKLVEDWASSRSGYTGSMEWRPVVDYEQQYEVSESGVRSLRTGRMLAPNRATKYISYHLSRGGQATNRMFHVLLAEAFIGPRPDGHYVLHRDDDKENNSLSNLYYGTPRQNNLDSVRNGRHHLANRTHCPRGHPLEEGNLVSRSKGRTCKACRDALNILRARPDLDFSVVADACYESIRHGTPNPYRRTRRQASLDMAAEGTHPMSRRTHCPRGHLLTEPNLEPHMRGKGYRSCLSCHRARSYLRNHPDQSLQVVSDRYYHQLPLGVST